MERPNTWAAQQTESYYHATVAQRTVPDSELLYTGLAWAVELTVTNPMPARRVPPSDGGHGLIGMRERATLLGGKLDADRVDGMFRVRARIP